MLSRLPTATRSHLIYANITGERKPGNDDDGNNVSVDRRRRRRSALIEEGEFPSGDVGWRREQR